MCLIIRKKLFDYLDDSQNNEMYAKFERILPQLIELYEYIEKETPLLFNKEKSTDKKAKSLPGIICKAGYTKFTKTPTTHKVNASFVIFCMSSLRPLLYEDGRGSIKFKINPIKFWQKYGARMLATDIDDLCKVTSTILSRNGSVYYKSLYNQANDFYNQELKSKNKDVII